MKEDRLKRYQILDGTILKMIAMVTMVFDHVGDNFFPEQTWMRIIGRMAFPIFAFFVCEGYIHTRDRIRYLERMILFGLISEIPFDLVTAGKLLEFTHQNIMLTFAFAVTVLLCYDRITDKVKGRKGIVIGVMMMIASGIVSIVLGLDYNIAALAVIFVYYLLRERSAVLRNIIAMAVHFLLRNVGIYVYGILGFLPLFLYNGKRGKGLKWLFYVFYPGHLLLIYLIREMM